MSDKTTDRWNEPINAAIIRYDLLFEAPRWNIAVWVVLFVVAAAAKSMIPMYVAGAWHAIAVALTRYDPEWPAILHDFFSEPGEID